MKNILSIIKGTKKRHNIDLIFLTCIDIEKGGNFFVATDDFSKHILEKTLNVNFKDNIAKRKGIVMRKEMVPLIKACLESLRLSREKKSTGRSIVGILKGEDTERLLKVSKEIREKADKDYEERKRRFAKQIKDAENFQKKRQKID